MPRSALSVHMRGYTFLPRCPQHEVVPPMYIPSANAPLKSAPKHLFLGFAWPRGVPPLWREFASAMEGVPVHCQEHAICICVRLPLPFFCLCIQQEDSPLICASSANTLVRKLRQIMRFCFGGGHWDPFHCGSTAPPAWKASLSIIYKQMPIGHAKLKHMI